MTGRRNAMSRFLLLAMLVGLLCWSVGQTLATGQESPKDALERGFKTPPDAAKPRVWWHWMNGNAALPFIFQALVPTPKAIAQRIDVANKNDTFTYGGGPAGIRYSRLKQINRTNVQQLEIAWTYDTAEGPGDTQTQPVIAEGVLYGVKTKHKIIR